jgi:riboflavin biosynthesis pyrimidine reductase
MRVIFERPRLPSYPLPPRLRRLYGGDLGFPSRCLYGNMVTSLDGAAALGVPGVASAPLISARNAADRFLMGLLRACCDVLLLGARTLRTDSGHRWTPDYIYPPLASDFARLRQTLGRDPEPRLAVVTASGNIDPVEPSLQAGALVLAPSGRVGGLRRRLSAGTTVLDLGPAPVEIAAVVAALRAEGHRVILTEGGPTLLGELIGAGMLDQLFLTLSPRLAGRKSGGPRRLALVEELSLLPETVLQADLMSARREGSHLFLRYRFPKSQRSGPGSRATR